MSDQFIFEQQFIATDCPVTIEMPDGSTKKATADFKILPDSKLKDGVSSIEQLSEHIVGWNLCDDKNEALACTDEVKLVVFDYIFIAVGFARALMLASREAHTKN